MTKVTTIGDLPSQLLNKNDIAVFYDEDSKISHTAIYTGENTFNSKNGERILNEVEDFKALQEEYGLIVEFYTGGKNRGIESLTKKPENGKINFTVDEVYKILKEEKKRIKNEKKQH